MAPLAEAVVVDAIDRQAVLLEMATLSQPHENCNNRGQNDRGYHVTACKSFEIALTSIFSAVSISIAVRTAACSSSRSSRMRT